MSDKILKYNNWKKIIESKDQIDPKYTYYPHNGQIELIEWEDENGKLHREGGPAEILYYTHGQLEQETWYTHGEKDREDGPATVKYYPFGVIEKEIWYKNGKAHREDGPAFIEYSERGRAFKEIYYLNDKRVKEEDIEELKAKKRLKDSFNELGIEDLIN